MEKSDRELDQRPHGNRMVRDRAGQNESESGNPLGVSCADGREGQGGKGEQYQRGRILRTHRVTGALIDGTSFEGCDGVPLPGF